MSAGVFVGVLGWVIAGLLAAFLAVLTVGMLAGAAGVLRDRRRGAVCRCGAVVFDKLTNYCGNCGQALDWN